MKLIRIKSGQQPFIQVRRDKFTQALLQARTAKHDNEWADRTNAAAAQALRYGAEVGYVRLMERIPTGEKYQDYRNSLTIARIIGPPDSPAYAITSRKSPQRVRTLDAPKTLLYVYHTKRQMRRPAKEIDVLVKHSPWTMETLPFSPNKNQAVVIQKKVTAREVARVTRARKATQHSWGRALSRCGVKLAQKPDLAQNLRVIPDTTLDALSLEFGSGTVRKHAHWRPAINYVVDSIQDFVDRPEVARALLDPTFRGWMRWPFPTALTITEVEAKKYVPFQERLGIVI